MTKVFQRDDFLEAPARRRRRRDTAGATAGTASNKSASFAPRPRPTPLHVASGLIRVVLADPNCERSLPDAAHGHSHLLLALRLAVERLTAFAEVMNLHVPPELEAKLTRLAGETGRTVDQVALDLLASSMDHDEWFRAEVEKGRAAAREGRLLEHDDVAARMDR